MDWWNELWLNEGFATWVGWLATDHFHPEFQVWCQFVTEAVQTAQQLDSLRGSHPIDVPIKAGQQVEEIFDAISYLKGSSVIRMLSNHLGVDTFLRGVSNYLKAHAYGTSEKPVFLLMTSSDFPGNATTSDLWAALSKASGKDVSKFMVCRRLEVGFDGDSLSRLGSLDQEDWLPSSYCS